MKVKDLRFNVFGEANLNCFLFPYSPYKSFMVYKDGRRYKLFAKLNYSEFTCADYYVKAFDDVRSLIYSELARTGSGLFNVLNLQVNF